MLRQVMDFTTPHSMKQNEDVPKAAKNVSSLTKFSPALQLFAHQDETPSANVSFRSFEAVKRRYWKEFTSEHSESARHHKLSLLSKLLFISRRKAIIPNRPSPSSSLLTTLESVVKKQQHQTPHLVVEQNPVDSHVCVCQVKPIPP